MDKATGIGTNVKASIYSKQFNFSLIFFLYKSPGFSGRLLTPPIGMHLSVITLCFICVQLMHLTTPLKHRRKQEKTNTNKTVMILFLSPSLYTVWLQTNNKAFHGGLRHLVTLTLRWFWLNAFLDFTLWIKLYFHYSQQFWVSLHPSVHMLLLNFILLLYCASASTKHERRSLLQSCAWLRFQMNLNHSFVCHLMRISPIYCLLLKALTIVTVCLQLQTS